MALPRYVPHYGVEDYELWEGRWELWSGVPIAMSPSPSRRHQEIAANLLFCLRRALTDSGCADCRVLQEIDWRVNEDTVVRPDLVVLCGHSPSRWVEQAPQFIAEVLSESTRHRDLLYKREMYETLGVKYYLIADPEPESFQLLVNEGSGFEATTNSVLELTESCRLQVDFSGLFD